MVSVTEGPINWDDFTVSRGQINAQKGLLCGQAAPYGYDCMLVDKAGGQRQRIHSGQKFRKPRGWRTKLVPSDDALKVSTVKWLFQNYADTDTGLRSLASQLNARGVPGPGGGPWYAASIKAIFENRNYTGSNELPVRSRQRGRPKKHFGPVAEQIVHLSEVRCNQRLGGLLKSYSRNAA